MKEPKSPKREDELEDAATLLARLGAGGYTIRATVRLCTAALLMSLAMGNGAGVFGRNIDILLQDIEPWPFVIFCIYIAAECRFAFALATLKRTTDEHLAGKKEANQAESFRVLARLGPGLHSHINVRRAVRSALIVGASQFAIFNAIWGPPRPRYSLSVSSHLYAFIDPLVTVAFLVAFWALVYVFSETLLSRSLKELRSRIEGPAMVHVRQAPPPNKVHHGAA